MNEREKHILVVRLSALGDVAMGIPAIYSVARQYPNVKLTVVTSKFFSRLFLNSPSNISIEIADTKGEHKGFMGLMRLIRTLDKLGITHVADLHNVLRSWVITSFFALKGKKVAMVNKGRMERRRLLSHHQSIASENYVRRYEKVFARLGYPAENTFTSLFEGIKDVRLPLKIEENAIGIAPFARYENKTYPLEQMKRVVKELSDRGIHTYIFGGGESEKAVAEQWAGEFELCTSLVGKYQIEEELAIMSQLDVLISMDSANQHLASLVATRVVTLWGSTTPVCGFSAFSQSPDDALCLAFPCQPCSIAGSKKCRRGDFACLREISPELIVENVVENILVSQRFNTKEQELSAL